MGGAFITERAAARADGIAAVRRALELGLNFVDTAAGYSDSEEVLGLALDGVPQPYILSTKLGGRPEPFDARDRDLLRRSVDDSLRLLKRDTVDILMIHEPDRPGQYDWFSDWQRFHGPVIDLLADLRREGNCPLRRHRRHHRLRDGGSDRERAVRRGADRVQLQPALAGGAARTGCAPPRCHGAGGAAPSRRRGRRAWSETAGCGGRWCNWRRGRGGRRPGRHRRRCAKGR